MNANLPLARAPGELGLREPALPQPVLEGVLQPRALPEVVVRLGERHRGRSAGGGAVHGR
jgi:hypothetical protein